ncbi:MAG: ankyrin repeat domain-containing protein [Solirubrobacteraceae bacterium]
MSTLPSNPNLDQLRHQARDLLRASQAGDREASERIGSYSAQVTLAGAQLVIAREYGFPSWPALKAEVQARTQTLTEAVDAFLTFSVNGRIGRAGQLLAQHPEIEGHDVRTAIALGDASRVSHELARDPELVKRRDPRNQWTALHLACASRWHVDPARVEGLVEIVRMLLDAGTELDRPPTAESQWRPLRCTIASAGSGRGNEPIMRMLLERGAEVADHDLYLGGFTTGGGEWCVRLLIEHTPDVRAIAEQALAAPLSLDDVGGVRVLLEAGADPSRYRDDEGRPIAVIPAAIDAGCSLELIELLLAHGADPVQAGDDGRSAYAVATASGRDDLVALLERHGARDDATPLDHIRYACLRGDRTRALELLNQHPTLRSEVADADGSALILAAETGDAKALELLLEVGFPVGAKGEPNGGTPLHVAAWAGSTAAVNQLLAAGAPIDAHDSTWDSPPLVWALVGSGERRAPNPTPDWLQTVTILLDAGAQTAQVKLDHDDPIQPSPEVVELLRARGIVPAENTRP